jgi:DNA polymerase (family 10)
MELGSIVAVLEEQALLLDLAGENVFKVRAYSNGARALEAYEGAWPPPEGALKQVKGIGAGLQADIKELLATGSLAAHQQLLAATPGGLLEMMAIPGLGPKKVKAIHEGLGITTVGELEYACLENRLVDLPGFGEKTQAKVLASIERWKLNRGKRLYADVVTAAEELLAVVRKLPGVQRAALAGALRRRCEIVEDIVLVAASTDMRATLQAFHAQEKGQAAGSASETAASINHPIGLPATLHVAPPAAFGTELLRRTGSDAFVAGLGALKDAADEAELTAVPPELREGPWKAGALPTLVEDRDLQGVFHVHTRYSDGEATVKDMALKARQLGYRYLGISDHSEQAFYARGLKRDQILAQRAEIAALNDELEDITLLSGIEADILADGQLDYDDEVLAGFDFVIGSVHSRFGQDREAMTNRLVRALEHPRLTMLGHMTGRLLLSRDAYDFDLDAVLAAAAKHGKVIELNANPHRLDIDWRDLGKARALGIPISINPDAHSPAGLEHTRFGVAVARKGGLGPDDVFNARPLDAVKAFLKR